jgi:hypothetical protein
MDDRARFLARQKVLQDLAEKNNDPELRALASEPMEREVAGTEITKDQRDASLKILEELAETTQSPMIIEALKEARARNPEADEYENEMLRQKELEQALQARLAELDKAEKRPINPNIGDVTGKNKRR